MPGVGDTAPNFSKPDFISGGTFTLSDHSGEVILLAFGNG
jgi:peroxiredoxin